MASTLDYAAGYTAFKVEFVGLYFDIDASLIFIGNARGNSWHENLAVDLMHGFVMMKQKAPGSKSILLCFKE
jgi:hypothetical protein